MWGANPVPIPTSNDEEADWLATLGGFRLLAEETSKFENSSATAARESVLAAGEVHSDIAPIAPNNLISGIIRKAARQLETLRRTPSMMPACCGSLL